MSIPQNFNFSYAYHFTSLQNLDSVIEHGLLSTNRKNQNAIQHVNVAAQGIQSRRSTMIVSGAQGKVVHDYVPFYFAKRTPMQLAVINKKNVDQELIIYFAVPLGIIDSRAGIYFSDASANTDVPPRFYDASQSVHLSNLNWQVIRSGTWSYPDEHERHQKMAELLVPEIVCMQEVAYIIAWNESMAQYIRARFEAKGVVCPNIQFDEWHYFMDRDNPGHSIVVGPYFLKQNFEKTVNNIIAQRRPNTKFASLRDALNSVKVNFGSIQELADIEGLTASYGFHRGDVAEHSRRVAANVVTSPEYLNLGEEDRMILEMAAYLHDIGKGPKLRWPNQCMNKSDSNHSSKSLPMLERILVEDIGFLSDDAIRKLVMLVTYDDLVGEIAAKERDKQQFFDIVKCDNDIHLLVGLGRADMKAIFEGWYTGTYHAIEQLKVEAMAYLQGRI